MTTKEDEPKTLYEFYSRRGEGENWIKDFKLYVTKPIGSVAAIAS